MIKKAIAPSFILFLFIFISCSGEMTPVLKDMVGLNKKFQEEYRVKNVRISIQNDHHLILYLVNSRFGKLNPNGKKVKAREMAEFAYNNFENKAVLDTVRISFTIHKRYFFLYSYTNSLDSYEFKSSELSKTGIS